MDLQCILLYLDDHYYNIHKYIQLNIVILLNVKFLCEILELPVVD